MRVTEVQRPTDARYDSRYTVSTMKQPAKIMLWGCMSAYVHGSIHFIPQGETVNANKYKKILKDKLKLILSIHNCDNSSKPQPKLLPTCPRSSFCTGQVQQVQDQASVLTREFTRLE